ncbi:polysaccharide deacetylase family protein [Tautonia plasticadhaerens]|uniref:Polysaccharide deacetylase n=1 Tax=Tautonia plasticadhaerens TaxID=2527974 RepID=A0A518GYU7_9BACT|nr:polysaccharide deacetylase family protein [Tautonia plasticadhaerens]QDV33780.1 Polysaccharide deacetylase [Tautonia plasticadhaerens]
MIDRPIGRRGFLAGAASAGVVAAVPARGSTPSRDPVKATIAITLDLEMSRQYPTRGQSHWDYEKGNLDDDTKRYAVEAARRVADRGGRIHFFALGRTMEQEDIGWIEEIAGAGHPIGNHTYDHVNVLASDPESVQFRFRRAPWLIEGKSTEQVISENVRIAERALRARLGIEVAGFRTPGGFHGGIAERPDIQRMLIDQGYRWVSSKYPSHPTTEPGTPPGDDILDGIVASQAEAQPFAYASGLIEVPMSPISDVGAFRTARWPLDAFLESIRRSVSWAIDHGASFDFLGHPSCLLVEDPGFRTIELICDLVARSEGRAELVDLQAIASRVSAWRDGSPVR